MKKIFNQFACSKIILPEHRQMLQKLHDENSAKCRIKPAFDQQEFERWERLIKNSIHNGSVINIQTTESNVYSGVVTKLDYTRKIIFMDTGDGIKQIGFDKVAVINN